MPQDKEKAELYGFRLFLHIPGSLVDRLRQSDILER